MGFFSTNIGKRKYLYLAVFAVLAGWYAWYNWYNNSFPHRYSIHPPHKAEIVVCGKNVSPFAVQYTKDVLETALGMPTEVTYGQSDFLNDIYNAKRKQYDVDKLLMLQFNQNPPRKGLIRLFLLNEDIYVNGTNFVLGIGHQGWNMAFVSVKRFENKIGGFLLNNAYNKKILRTLVMHETGHAFGLRHCHNPCVMKYGDSVSEEIDKKDWFCPKCEALLKDIGKLQATALYKPNFSGKYGYRTTLYIDTSTRRYHIRVKKDTGSDTTARQAR